MRQKATGTLKLGGFMKAPWKCQEVNESYPGEEGEELLPQPRRTGEARAALLPDPALEGGGGGSVTFHWRGITGRQ